MYMRICISKYLDMKIHTQYIRVYEASWPLQPLLPKPRPVDRPTMPITWQTAILPTGLIDWRAFRRPMRSRRQATLWRVPTACNGVQGKAWSEVGAASWIPLAKGQCSRDGVIKRETESFLFDPNATSLQGAWIWNRSHGCTRQKYFACVCGGLQAFVKAEETDVPTWFGPKCVNDLFTKPLCMPCNFPLELLATGQRLLMVIRDAGTVWCVQIVGNEMWSGELSMSVSCMTCSIFLQHIKQRAMSGCRCVSNTRSHKSKWKLCTRQSVAVVPAKLQPGHQQTTISSVVADFILHSALF